MIEISLPTGVVKSISRDPKLLLLYSIPKIGKTTVLSKLPNSLLIDLEEGSDFVDAVKIKVNSLKELKEVGTAIIKAKKPYKTVIIDTATKLEEWCLDYALELYKAQPIGSTFEGDSVLELPRGAGYYWLRKAFQEWINKIKKLADNIILVCHLKDSSIEKKGKEVSHKEIDLTGKLKSIVSTDADAICYMYRDDDNNLIANFKGTDEVVCGSRCNHLKGQEIVLAEYDSTANDVKNVKWELIYESLKK
jgi:hypothetical protein